MISEELKVRITADDSNFSKAINKIQGALSNIKIGNLGKSFDNATVDVDRFQNNFLRAMRDFNKTSKTTAKASSKSFKDA